ncbi:MAG: hypothetical protein GY817_00415 [bacterium]|nr:hypothetical protein [bacterium]
MDKINWDLLDEKDINFAFNESKEKLKNTIDFRNKLQNKSFILLSIFITIISGFSGFILNDKTTIFLRLFILILVVGFLIGLFFLIKCIKTDYFHSLGNLPTTILNVKNKENFDYLYMIECELLSYDKRIKENLNINKLFGLNINKALKSILVSFFIAFIFLIVCLFFGL